ncbi:MAG: FecCD family ABC transporter permease [Candidatus Latescibacterota bacterium]|jgi:iron complex transport system permease protein
MDSQRLYIALFALVALLAFSAVISLCIGPVNISIIDIIRLIWQRGDPDSINAVILFDIRLPRLILAALVGAALAQSGVVMQGFFQNPMADPYIVGVSSGAGLGATLAIWMGLDFWFYGLSGVGLLAFVGALIVTAIVYLVSQRGGRLPIMLVLLTGVAIGALTSALTSFLMVSAQGDLFDTQRILFWMMGSLASRRWEHVQVVWPQIVVGALFLQWMARDLNLIIQGEENALYLGVDVERTKRLLLIGASLLAAAAVSVSGIIGFVGLVVPHVMRLVVGPDNRRLMPASMLGGAILLVNADLLARVVIEPAELPIGIITSLLGCPFFLYLLSRRRDIGI